ESPRVRSHSLATRVELRSAFGGSSLTFASLRFDSRRLHSQPPGRFRESGRFLFVQPLVGGGSLHASARIRSPRGWSSGPPSADPRSPSLRFGSTPAGSTLNRPDAFESPGGFFVQALAGGGSRRQFRRTNSIVRPTAVIDSPSSIRVNRMGKASGAVTMT